MTDVLLEDTRDGGEIEITNGRVAMDDGLRTSAYLSLFGGNVEDGGLDGDSPSQWWANFVEDDSSRHLRSETQHLLHTLPATPASLRRIEDAVERDLAWMTADFAESVEATASIPSLNRITLEVSIRVDARAHDFTFTEDWTDQ